MTIVLMETEDEAKKGINNAHVESLEDKGYVVERLVICDEHSDALFITSQELDGIGIANITKKMHSIPETKVYSNWQNFFDREINI